MSTAIKSMSNGGIHAIPDEPGQVLSWLLTHTTPLSMIEARPGRAGAVYYYLRHQYVTEVLNKITGFDWDFEILREWCEGDQVTCVGRLTIRVGDRTVIKTQYGGGDVERYSGGKNEGKPLSIADAYKGAASDALKKCTSLLGLGLDLSIPVKENHFKALHATGTRVFKDRWDKVRPIVVRGVSGGRKVDDHLITSSRHLLDIEARLATAAIDKEHPDHNLELVEALSALLRPAIIPLLK